MGRGEARYRVYFLKSICNIDRIHIFLTAVMTEKKLKSILVTIINFKFNFERILTYTTNKINRTTIIVLSATLKTEQNREEKQEIENLMLI